MKKHPAHDLPHFSDGSMGIFFVTGTNYLHKKIIGKSHDRLDEFMVRMIDAIESVNFELHAFCVMPNHYHIIVDGTGVEILRTALGKVHGLTSRKWNLEDDQVGRKVWFRAFDRQITSNRSYYSILNYIHYNPVKACLCKRITEWSWSSAEIYIKGIGKDHATSLWKEYPPAK
ncbi:MAG: transposase [Puniceicoccaceae bacterium]